MCFGLEPATIALIAGGLASAGGSVMQSQAAQKNAQARADQRNRVLQHFQEKNKSLSEEARSVLQDRMSQEQDTPQEAVEPLQRQRAEESQAVLDRSATSAPIQLAGNAPTVVADTAAEAQERTAEGASDRSEAMAKARAFGDMVFNKGLATQDAGDEIGQIGGFARANNRLLPIQQDLTEQTKMGVGSTLGKIGGVTSALGSLASTAGGSGMLGSAGGGAASGQNFFSKGGGLFGLGGQGRVPVGLGNNPVNLGL